MNKKSIWKAYALALLTIVVLIGLSFYVRHEIKMYKSIVELSGKTAVMQDFLIKSFPEQVSAYDTSKK
jgi:hypothetical protein